MDLLNNTAPRSASVPAAQPFVQAQPPPAYGAPLGGFNAGHRPAPSLSSQPAFASPITPQVQPQAQNFFGGAARPTAAPQPSFNAGPVRPGSTPAAAAKPASNFDDLWSLGLGSTSKPATPAPVGGTKSIQALQQEKAQASIWGAKPSGQQQKPQPAQFPSFGAAPASGAGGASSAGDDLLL
jgi:epsin